MTEKIEKELTVFERLQAVQQELKAPKSQFNKFGNFSYRSCEDILEAVKPLLKKHALVLTISDDLISSNGRYYIQAKALLFNSGGEKIEVTSYAREEETKKGMDGSQITGAASSYARKYALNGLFLIDDTKDADAQAPPQAFKPKPTPEPKPKPLGEPSPDVTKPQLAKIFAMAKEKRVEPEDMKIYLKATYNIESTKELTKSQASNLISEMEGWPDYALKKEGEQEDTPKE